MHEWYSSLLDVPLDEQDPSEDGDDQLVPPDFGFDAPVVAARFASPPVVRVVAPYPGKLKRGDRGKSVRAINRALSHAGFRRWQVFSRLFTRWVEKALKRFQAAHGITTTGVYTLETHKALSRHFDAYDLKHLLVAAKPKPTRDELERAAFVAELMYVYNRRWQIPYSQARAFDTRKPPRALDCSASGEWAAKWAKLRSLSGYSSFGYGNTDTQISRLRRLGRHRSTIRDAEPGDPIYYGRGGDPSHVAYYLGHHDGRARCWSFGSYPAKILDAAYRHDQIGVFNLTGR